jgi:hypothetical protein
MQSNGVRLFVIPLGATTLVLPAACGPPLPLKAGGFGREGRIPLKNELLK